MNDKTTTGEGAESGKSPAQDQMKAKIENAKSLSTDIPLDSALEAELKNGETEEQAAKNVKRKTEEKRTVRKLGK